MSVALFCLAKNTTFQEFLSIYLKICSVFPTAPQIVVELFLFLSRGKPFLRFLHNEIKAERVARWQK
jgi:hypothetical protein